MNTKEDLIQRWDAFLLKIEQRFNESLKYAEEACKEQLVATDYEYETVIRSWGGMKAQINDLIQKIDATWHAKVQSEMRVIGDFYIQEGYKSSELNDNLTDRLYNFQRRLEGELSEEFYNHAIQIANKKAFCSQCNAAITIRKDVFRAQYITCGFCNTVNTVEPETKFQKIGWGIIDNMAAIRCQKVYEKLQEAQNNLREQRKPVDKSYWTAYEKAYYEYWKSYFNERIKLNSSAAERYESDMERKEKEFENFKEIQTK